MQSRTKTIAQIKREIVNSLMDDDMGVELPATPEVHESFRLLRKFRAVANDDIRELTGLLLEREIRGIPNIPKDRRLTDEALNRKIIERSAQLQMSFRELYPDKSQAPSVEMAELILQVTKVEVKKALESDKVQAELAKAAIRPIAK